MNTNILMTKSMFPVFSIWALTVLLLWFRPRIEIFWKLVASLIFIFYVWFFHEDLIRGYENFTLAWYEETLAFIKEFLGIVFVTLFLIWPLSLILIFYTANDMGAERLLKFLCLLTLILWLLFIIYYLFSEGIDHFMYDEMKKLLPKF